MKWNQLNSLDTLVAIDEASKQKPVVIFKHSTRCSISMMALSRFERNWKEANTEKVSPYYLDLLQYRPISQAIAKKYHIVHESPQVLLIKNGVCTFSCTHNAIDCAELMDQVGQA